MVRTISYVFGAILALVGIWGFLQNPVFGIFDSNVLHSVVHLATGVVLLALATWWSEASATACKVFGVVYALIAIVGFVMGGDMLFGLIDNSVADGILHTLLAVVFLWAGFMGNEMVVETQNSTL